MINLNLILYISLAMPFIMFLLIFNGKVRRVFAFLLLGLTICLLCGEINGLIIDNVQIDLAYFSINISPIIEEALKMIPILLCVYLLKPTSEELLMCSLIIGIGFAIQENAYVLAKGIDSLTIMSSLFRAFGAGLMHGICTLMVGYGLTYVKKDRCLAICGTFALFALAIMYHSTYNCIVQSKYSLFGIILPVVTFLILFIILKTRNKQVET